MNWKVLSTFLSFETVYTILEVSFLQSLVGYTSQNFKPSGIYWEYTFALFRMRVCGRESVFSHIRYISYFD